MNIAIGVGLCMLSCAMAGLGMGLALTESTAIYGFVTALIMIFTLK